MPRNRTVIVLAVLLLFGTLASAPGSAQDRAQQRGEVVSPTWPPAANDPRSELRFRGSRQRVTSDLVREFDGRRLRMGGYFVDADTSDRVIVTRIHGGRVELESPGQWQGTGLLQDSTYWGVFTYTNDAREPKNRGARGVHAGTIDALGRVHVQGRFTNRPWGSFQSTWTSESDAIFAGIDSAGGMRRHSITREQLREIPVEPYPGQRLERSPVWPPPQMPGAPSERSLPAWPQVWYHGGTQVLLEDPDYDVKPVVTRQVPLQMGEAVPRAGGLVVVQVRIGRDGSVTSARIARSVPGLDEAALLAARLWRFTPAMRHGEAVAAVAYLPFLFTSM